MTKQGDFIMTRILALAAAVGLSIAPALAEPTVMAGGLTLKTVTVEFPTSSRIFPGAGAGANAINANCVTCHSASMVLTQPRLSKAVWGEEVAKMRKVYGAPLADGDVALIVDYLAGLEPGK